MNCPDQQTNPKIMKKKFVNLLNKTLKPVAFITYIFMIPIIIEAKIVLFLFSQLRPDLTTENSHYKVEYCTQNPGL